MVVTKKKLLKQTITDLCCKHFWLGYDGQVPAPLAMKWSNEKRPTMAQSYRCLIGSRLEKYSDRQQEIFLHYFQQAGLGISHAGYHTEHDQRDMIEQIHMSWFDALEMIGSERQQNILNPDHTDPIYEAVVRLKNARLNKAVAEGATEPRVTWKPRVQPQI